MKTALLFVVSSGLLAAAVPTYAYQMDDLQECFQVCRETYPGNGAAIAACKQRCIFYPGKNVVSSRADGAALPVGAKSSRPASR